MNKELDRLIRQADGYPDKMPVDEGVKSELPDPKSGDGQVSMTKTILFIRDTLRKRRDLK